VFLKDPSTTAELRSRARHSGFDDVALPSLPATDGLINPSEERYLYWLASEAYSGEGALVEVGSWFGRSAMCLGAGLRDAGFSTPLFCFDRFEWKAAFDAFDMIADVDLPDGGDFMPYMERNVRPVYDHVEITKSDVADIDWTGGDIEILFVDAPKNFAEFSMLLLKFGRSLIGGRSLIVLQDYFYSPAYPLALTMASLGDQVRLVHTVTGSSSAAFALERPMTDEVVPPSWRYWELSDDAIRELWHETIDAIPEAQRSLLEPGLAFYFLDRKKPRLARQYFATIEFSDLGRHRWDFLRKQPGLARRIERLEG
jgi:hypothetical protein